jgi:hypothetical protein
MKQPHHPQALTQHLHQIYLFNIQIYKVLGFLCCLILILMFMNAGNHNGMDELDYTTNVTKPENKTLIQKPKIKP